MTAQIVPVLLEVLAAADLALRFAKSNGTGIEIYNAAMGTAMVREARLRRDLPLAVERGDIRLAFQPIVDLNSGRTVALEALARWRHPHFGNVPPAEFIAIAEQGGTIGPLGDRLLREAMQACAPSCTSIGRRLAVNVSALQLRDQLFAPRLAAAIRETGMDANMLDLEITESTALDGPTVRNTLSRLRDSGIGLVVDDFGAGSSRLSYLADFPITALKLDRALVETAGTSPRHEVFLKGVVSVAHLLGIRVIGEGIQSQEHLEMLKRIGCDQGQGYLLGTPSELQLQARAG